MREGRYKCVAIDRSSSPIVNYYYTHDWVWVWDYSVWSVGKGNVWIMRNWLFSTCTAEFVLATLASWVVLWCNCKQLASSVLSNYHPTWIVLRAWYIHLKWTCKYSMYKLSQNHIIQQTFPAVRISYNTPMREVGIIEACRVWSTCTLVMVMARED